ncbi:tetratricopeptide repeat protein [Knoellia sp. 3-2P3]|uniref:tetratricopeptide repeat protein n=1 Tax=unclassified Knoellia TaxID=2618719 RepID=UPI0023DB9E24|nr:tetratricopeptide repeat protein [Knoellia sp. 3-2P3]MDF2093025.1 tetratricopeptide repeat protein [Knoellia sp. 3-2P3]
MTEQPFNPSALRGAVDLSGLQAPRGGAGAAGSGAGAPGAAEAGGQRAGGGPGAAGSNLVVQGTDANFSEVLSGSVSVPAVVVLWSARLPESGSYLDTVVAVANSYGGRFQVVSVDVDDNPGLLRAFQIQSVPVTIGLVQGQPVPLFAGVQGEQEIRPIIDELLALAVQHGVTGRIEVGEPADAEPEEPPLPPLHQEAYDAIERGDLDAAADAYRKALAQNPADSDAELGLAQVGLMQRTAGVDLQQARQAAADNPGDIDAQTLVADLDLLGGHVEDAFLRLIDLVKATSGDDRERVRTHLLELFAVVGPHDERVRKARGSLMSALF